MGRMDGRNEGGKEKKGTKEEQFEQKKCADLPPPRFSAISLSAVQGAESSRP
jgi:hypothetical protein